MRIPARPELNFTRAKTAAKFRDGVVKFDESIAVPLSEDSHIIVVACSEHNDLHTGHDFTPNGDTLGWPLPTKKISIEDAKKMLTERGLDASAPEPETSL